jgi:PD-(D/E)XK nuclease superfamily
MISAAKELTHAFSKIFEEGTVSIKNDPLRVKRLRFSGLPYCQVKHFASLPQALALSQSKDFRFGFYTSVGTAVHSSVQSALSSLAAKSLRVKHIADWKCLTCGKLHSFQTQPDQCSFCRSIKFEFQEHTISIDLGPKHSKIFGHVDTIFQRPDTSLIIVDWKTTSQKNLRKSVENPSLSYLTQLRSYAAAISHSSGLRVDSIALGFIPRDNPNDTEFYVEAYQDKGSPYLNMLRYWSSDHQQTLRVSKESHLQTLVDKRPCKDALHPSHQDCPMAKRCAGNDEGALSILQNRFAILKSKDRLPVINYLEKMDASNSPS